MPATPKPEGVRVGPLVYTITFDEDAINASSIAANTKQTGFTDLEACTMLIRPTLAADQQRVTVVHEILHAIVDAAGLTCAPGGPLEPDVEEQTVTAMAPAILGVLRDNPALVAWLVAYGGDS